MRCRRSQVVNGNARITDEGASLKSSTIIPNPPACSSIAAAFSARSTACVASVRSPAPLAGPPAAIAWPRTQSQRAHTGSHAATAAKALAASKNAKLPRSYWSWDEMLAPNKNGYFPYTPALPLLYGLKEAMAALEEEGLENVFKRHSYLAGGVRAAIRNGWKLDVCAKKPEWYSDRCWPSITFSKKVSARLATYL